MPNTKVAAKSETAQKREEDGRFTENDAATKSSSTSEKPKDSDSKSSGATGKGSQGQTGKIASSPPAGSKDDAKSSNGNSNNQRAKSR